MPTSLPSSGHFELETAFEGASSILTLMSIIKVIEDPTQSPASSVQRRLIVHSASNIDADVLISPMLAHVEREGPPSPKPSCDEGSSAVVAILEEPEVSSTGVEIVPMNVSATMAIVAKATIVMAQVRLEAAPHQKEELELDLAELTKKWDSQVAELQAKTERLSVVKSQVIPLDPRILREQAQKGAHEIRDAQIVECVAQIHTFYPLSL
ncbi:uncharacterized protein A4U43_C01F12760 [Asparagus officinalis]|uniref:Uncharacterized protein n=1 Tax=Asparagus officinalis TaxID=4686 RepID=A0A5P1FNW3_ASPOF|nr:uncharacterized protein A4U43_C01F12760 [Asparagus officinalis]